MNKLGCVPVGDSNHVRIMSILNTSPESFYKKSIQQGTKEITETIQRMEEEGADFIDIGGMSTAPYLSTIVSEKTESERVTKAIKIAQRVSNLPISVDTCRSIVAKNALELGVDIINDISGLKYDKEMINVINKYQPSVILCAFSKNTVHGNALVNTKKLLKQSLILAKSANISLKNIILDPAIGFFRKSGKNPFFTKINSDWVLRDLLILKNLSKIKQKHPILVSVSNKSFIGTLLDKQNPADRLSGSLATEVLSVINGADIIRTHNVQETKKVVCNAQNLMRTNKGL